jgi:hypothetical protein
MTRMSKQAKKRAVSPRKHKKPSIKTGPKKDHLPFGYRIHANALEGNQAIFIAKIK